MNVNESLNLIKTRLHFTVYFLQKIIKNTRIILQLSRSTPNGFEAVQKYRSVCFIGSKILGYAPCFESDKTLLLVFLNITAVNTRK